MKKVMLVILSLLIIISVMAFDFKNPGHFSGVPGLLFTSDGKTMISGGYDGYIKIWDYSSGKLLKEIFVNKQGIDCISISYDNKYLVTGSIEKDIKIWDILSGKLMININKHTDAVNDIIFLKDNTFISVSGDKTIRLWDLKGKELKKAENNAGISKVSATSDGKYIIISDYNSFIKIYDGKTFKMLKEFDNQEMSVNAIKVTLDDKYFLSAGIDKTIKIWDIKNFKVLSELKGHNEGIGSIDISKDQKYIVSFSYDRTVILWDFITKKKVKEIQNESGNTSKLFFGSDSKSIIFADYSGTLKIKDIKDFKIINIIGNPEKINTTAYNSEKNILITGNDEGKICVWDLNSYSLKSSIKVSDEPILSMIVSNDGNTIICSFDDETIRIINIPAMKIVNTIEVNGETKSQPQDEKALSLVFYDNEKQFIAGTNKGNMKFYDTTSGIIIRTIKYETKNEDEAAPYFNKLAITPDNKIIFTGNAYMDYNIDAFDIENQKMIKTFKMQAFDVQSLKISPDGKYIVSSDYKAAYVWDIESGKLMMRLYEPDNQLITDVNFTPDQKYIAALNSDKILTLWDFREGKIISKFEVIERAYNFEFSPDMKYIFISGNYVEAYEYPSFKPVGQFAYWQDNEWFAQNEIGNWNGSVNFINNKIYRFISKDLRTPAEKSKPVQNMTFKITEKYSYIPEKISGIQIIGIEEQYSPVNDEVFIRFKIASENNLKELIIEDSKLDLSGTEQTIDFNVSGYGDFKVNIIDVDGNKAEKIFKAKVEKTYMYVASDDAPLFDKDMKKITTLFKNHDIFVTDVLGDMYVVENALGTEEWTTGYMYKTDVTDLILDAENIEGNNDAASLFEYGDQEYLNGNYEKAIEYFSAAIEADPTYVYAFNERGLCYDLLGYYEQAIEDYSKAIELNPNEPIYWRNRALAYTHNENDDKAIEDCTQAIKLNPKYVDAYNDRGIAYYNKKMYDMALTNYNQAIKIEPAFFYSYYNRALIYDVKGKYELAGKDYKTYVEYRKNDPEDDFIKYAKQRMKEIGVK